MKTWSPSSSIALPMCRFTFSRLASSEKNVNTSPPGKGSADSRMDTGEAVMQAIISGRITKSGRSRCTARSTSSATAFRLAVLSSDTFFWITEILTAHSSCYDEQLFGLTWFHTACSAGTRPAAR
ncbi:hypothetical protein D9M70_531880 [compost metagenome]